MHAAGVRNGDELVNFPSRVSLAAAIEKVLPRDSGDGDVVMAPRGGGGAPIEESSTIELVFRRASAVPFGIGWRARGPASSRAVRGALRHVVKRTLGLPLPSPRDSFA